MAEQLWCNECQEMTYVSELQLQASLTPACLRCGFHLVDWSAPRPANVTDWHVDGLTLVEGKASRALLEEFEFDELATVLPIETVLTIGAVHEPDGGWPSL